jgi:hypothetical protein
VEIVVLLYKFNVLQDHHGTEILVYQLEQFHVQLVHLGMEQTVFLLLFTVHQVLNGKQMDVMQLLDNVQLVQHGTELLAILNKNLVLQVLFGMEVHVLILEFLFIHVLQNIFGTDFVVLKAHLFKHVNPVAFSMVLVVLLFHQKP